MSAVNNIVVPIDFAEAETKHVEWAKNFQKTFSSNLHFIYVVPPLDRYAGFHLATTSLDSFMQDVLSGATKQMDEFIKSLNSSTSFGIIRSGIPVEEILEFSSEIKADMIVMGTQGRQGLDRLLFGSVAEKIVKQSHIPVLTVKPE